MSFIGAMFDPNKGAGFQAQGANIVNPVNKQQTDQAAAQAQEGIAAQKGLMQQAAGQGGFANQANVFQQQQNLANQLQEQAAGGGPNPALQQLQNTTGQNVAQQAALMASQRGAGANAGLMARQAAMQGAGIQQQATGQAALQRAQQQIAAQQALQQQQQMMGGLATQQVGQQAQATGALNQAVQGEQNQLLGAMGQANQANVSMQSNINQANAGIAAGNQKAQSDIFGGLLGAAGSAATMLLHDGGMVEKVPHYADGGLSLTGDSLKFDTPSVSVPKVGVESSGPKSSIGKMLQSFRPQGKEESALGYGASQLGNTLGSALGQGLKAGASAIGGAIGNAFKPAENTDITSENYHVEPEKVNPSEGYAKGGVVNMKKGGHVKGEAKVKGDNLKNDTVPAMLSPKEIVLPRSVTMHPDAPNKAAQFVAAVLAKKGMKGRQ